MLPTELWAVILCYFNYGNLINISACSKMLYFLSHENEKFVWELNCSRFILSHEDMFSKYDDLWLSFVLKVSHGLKECFDKKKTIVLVKKHIFWYYFWNPFIPCLHTFNCSMTKVIMTIINVLLVSGFKSQKKLYLIFWMWHCWFFLNSFLMQLLRTWYWQMPYLYLFTIIV